MKIVAALAGLAVAVLFAANSARGLLRTLGEEPNASRLPTAQPIENDGGSAMEPMSRPTAMSAPDLAPRFAAAFRTDAFLNHDPFEELAALQRRLEEERAQLERARAELRAQAESERSREPAAASRPAPAATAPKAALTLRGIIESGERSVALLGVHIIAVGQEVPGSKFTLQSIASGKAVFAGPRGTIELTPPLGSLPLEEDSQ
ncbi:MAG: hypothetical protein JNJ88_21465 [Planctomycetes bacterium]|nr:hypothetical protein [Planctomycetota bacterium]